MYFLLPSAKLIEISVCSYNLRSISSSATAVIKVPFLNNGKTKTEIEQYLLFCLRSC